MTDTKETLDAACAALLHELFGVDAPQPVLGEGPRGARLMLIGEAPGEQEAIAGRPFVGRAGKNLDRFLELAGLRREEIYITNAVKFRPTRMGKREKPVNRTPTDNEVTRFRPLLLREIRLMRPELIVTLGNVPLRAVTGEKISVGEVHGRVLDAYAQDVPVFALYHPASVIYNRSLAAVYEQDVRLLAALCAEGAKMAQM